MGPKLIIIFVHIYIYVSSDLTRIDGQKYHSLLSYLNMFTLPNKNEMLIKYWLTLGWRRRHRAKLEIEMCLCSTMASFRHIWFRHFRLIDYRKPSCTSVQADSHMVSSPAFSLSCTSSLWRVLQHGITHWILWHSLLEFIPKVIMNLWDWNYSFCVMQMSVRL